MQYQFEVVPIDIRFVVGQASKGWVETLQDPAGPLIRRSRAVPVGRYLGHRPVYLRDARRRTSQSETLDQLD